MTSPSTTTMRGTQINIDKELANTLPANACEPHPSLLLPLSSALPSTVLSFNDQPDPGRHAQEPGDSHGERRDLNQARVNQLVLLNVERVLALADHFCCRPIQGLSSTPTLTCRLPSTTSHATNNNLPVRAPLSNAPLLAPQEGAVNCDKDDQIKKKKAALAATKDIEKKYKNKYMDLLLANMAIVSKGETNVSHAGVAGSPVRPSPATQHCTPPTQIRQLRKKLSRNPHLHAKAIAHLNLIIKECTGIRKFLDSRSLLEKKVGKITKPPPHAFSTLETLFDDAAKLTLTTQTDLTRSFAIGLQDVRGDQDAIDRFAIVAAKTLQAASHLKEIYKNNWQTLEPRRVFTAYDPAQMKPGDYVVKGCFDKATQKATERDVNQACSNCLQAAVSLVDRSGNTNSIPSAPFLRALTRAILELSSEVMNFYNPDVSDTRKTTLPLPAKVTNKTCCIKKNA